MEQALSGRSLIESLLLPKGVPLEKILERLGPEELKNLDMLLEAHEQGPNQFEEALDKVYGPRPFKKVFLPGGGMGIWFPPDRPQDTGKPK